MTVAVQLIHREDLERRQLEKLWTEYESDERTGRSLLGAGCQLICPRVSTSRVRGQRDLCWGQVADLSALE